MAEEEPLIVSRHPGMFGCYRHYGSRDKMVLVCHVILEDHVIKGYCDFMDAPHDDSSPYQVWWP